jgi:hypothetical protein
VVIIRMTTKQKAEIEILTKALKQTPAGDACPSPKLEDYRELRVVYICTADLADESLCKYFSPGGNGDCTLRGENRTCRKTSV